MRGWIQWLTVGLIVLIGLEIFWHGRSQKPTFAPAPALSGEPNLMLWAWESPEDLRSLDPTRAGVAYLSRELLLGSTREVRLRHQPLFLPKNAFQVAVVRIETTPAFSWRDAGMAGIAQQIVAATEAPGIRVLQVDFDARASERAYYAELLRQVRQQLPGSISLSVTALVSWCGHGSWLHRLPVDEAVPMFFRMGGPTAFRIARPRGFEVVKEQLCAGSAGVATDERWPVLDQRQRLYLFHPGSWSEEDIALVNKGSYEGLQNFDKPSTGIPSP